MNIDTLVDIIASAIRLDSSILTWTQTTYSSAYTVQKGMDMRNPPSETDYPIVVIWPISKTVGYALSEKPHVVCVVCGINDDTLNTTTDTTGVVYKEYAGLADLEAFRKLVESSIIAELESNTATPEMLVNNLPIDYDPLEAFPFMLAMNIFEITKASYQGENIFE